jgi:hypothetical protein
MSYIIPGIILVAGFAWVGVLVGSFFWKMGESISQHKKNKRKRRMTEMADRRLIRTRVPMSEKRIA